MRDDRIAVRAERCIVRTRRDKVAIFKTSHGGNQDLATFKT